MLKFYMVFLLGFLSALASTRAGFWTYRAPVSDLSASSSCKESLPYMGFPLMWALQVRYREAWALCS